jgi:hypothetical protein
MCKNGARCTRPLCFFAHASSELRFPDCDAADLGSDPFCAVAAAPPPPLSPAAAAAPSVASGATAAAWPVPARGSVPLLAPRCVGTFGGVGCDALAAGTAAARASAAATAMALGGAYQLPPLQVLPCQSAFEVQPSFEPLHLRPLLLPQQACLDASWRAAAAAAAAAGAGADALSLVQRIDSGTSVSSIWSGGAPATPQFDLPLSMGFAL